MFTAKISRPVPCGVLILLAMAILTGNACGTANAQVVPAESDTAALFQRLDSVNNQAPPTAGTAIYRYARTVHPRYVDAERYERELAARVQAAEEAADGDDPVQKKAQLDAIPVNMALTLMNDTSEESRIAYYVHGSKFRIDKELLKNESRLNVPDYAKGNPHLRPFDRNTQQTMTWDGQIYVRQSRLQDAQWVATCNTQEGHKAASPPLMFHNAPRLTEFAKVADFQGFSEVELNGTPCWRLTFSSKDSAGQRKNHIFYRVDNGQFLQAESEEVGPENEIGRYRVVFSPEREPAAGLPRMIEFINTLQPKGRTERVVQHQEWKLESFDPTPPPDSIFAPNIRDDVVELAIFDGDKEMIRALDLQRSPQFVALLESVENIDPSLAGVSTAFDAWQDSKRLGATTADRNTPWKSLVLWANGLVLAVFVIVFLWRKRQPAQ